jgi:endonuclease YncB( thermonuclease family)
MRYRHPLHWPGLLLGLLLVAGSALAQPLTGRVVRVADGDTLTLLVDRSPIKVRLSAIDAPEKGQPFRTRSRQGLSGLCFGKTAEVTIRGQDRYGRTLGDVICDGQSANEALVSQGLAWVYQQYAPRNSALYELESAARSARRGLWADADPMAPWAWRNGHQREARHSLPAKP